MAEQKMTFYERHPKLATAAITVGLVGGLVGIVGGGAAIYQHEKNNTAQYRMQGREMQMRMRERMPMYRMGRGLERMLERDLKDLKPEAKQKVQEFYKRNQEFMKEYQGMMDKYRGDFRGRMKEFREDMAKLRDNYLTKKDYLAKGQEIKEQEPVRAVGEIKPPKLLKEVAPVYPEVARQAKVEGIVILEAQADEKGRVANVKVLRSIPLLDKAAIDAVKQWVYEPMVIKGEPRKVAFTVTVRFQLK